MGPHLVVAPALGYGPRDVKAFLSSLRQFHDGPVAVLTDDPQRLGPLLERFRADSLCPDSGRGYRPHPVTSRFADAAMALDLYPEAEVILLSDVRDVIFQADPFDPLPERLQLFQEAEPMTLAEHGSNIRWLGAILGRDIAATIADRPCICAGTVLGPRRTIQRMIRQMMLLLSIPRKAIPLRFGADQAILNYMAHMDLLGEVDVVPNWHRVATIGKASENEIFLDREGVVRNADGSASAIVHQYDRHDVIHAAVAAQHAVLEEPDHIRAQQRTPRIIRSLLKRIPELR